MTAVYDRMGVQFSYPENWSLDEGEALVDRGSVTVYSPGDAFWSLIVRPPSESPRQLIDEALAAMRQDYPDLDVENITETIAGWELIGYEINFFHLDLTNTAVVRSVATPQGTYVVHYQAEDRDFEQLQRVFEAITTSLLRSVRP